MAQSNVTVTLATSNVSVNETTSNVTVSSTLSNVVVSNTAVVTNSDIREAISGGYGISYSNVSGVIQTSNSDVRALVSGTSPITYNSGTGAIGIDSAAVFSGKTTDDLTEGSNNKYFTTSGATVNTTALPEGTNLYYTNARVNAYIIDNGLDFNADGTKLYAVDIASGEAIYQYSLTTAWDISTASYDSISFTFSSQDISPRSAVFGDSGTKLYMGGLQNDSIYQYSTVAYTQILDLSTGTTFSFTPSGATIVSFTNPPASGNAIAFSVIIGAGTDSITWPISIEWEGGAAPVRYNEKELYVFITADGGTTYYGKKAAEALA